MAWEHANDFFPLGYAILPGGSKKTIEELQKSEIKTLYEDIVKEARHMMIEKYEYIWGADGNFTAIEIFDANNLIPHATNVRPFNVYATNMINNYKVLNNIRDEDFKPIIE